MVDATTGGGVAVFVVHGRSVPLQLHLLSATLDNAGLKKSRHKTAKTEGRTENE